MGKIKARHQVRSVPVCAGACPTKCSGVWWAGKMAAACPGNRLTAFALPQNLVDLARVLIFAPLGLPHGAVVVLPVMGVFLTMIGIMMQMKGTAPLHCHVKARCYLRNTNICPTEFARS